MEALALSSKTEKKDIDKLLYVSTYQRGFDDRYSKDFAPGEVSPPSKSGQSDSLYQSSYRRPTAIGTASQRFGKRNVLEYETLCKGSRMGCCVCKKY
jgi:hypothetical protein